MLVTESVAGLLAMAIYVAVMLGTRRAAEVTA
jgi:hypothetical protein